VQRNAAEHGDRPFLVFPDAPTLTWRGAHDRVVQIACGLARLGVRRGEHVLSWLPTGSDSILLMLALNHVGAVYVPVNLAYRGRLLEHVVLEDRIGGFSRWAASEAAQREKPVFHGGLEGLFPCPNVSGRLRSGPG
jgi:acyl-CoA synthetase (AMP-forming)/AMP-acid ligase II